MLAYVFLILLFFTALFLILLVLVQRGKGGGLAGAFGGMGGQSAFGTKAGDTFTKITIGTAAFWIILCVVSIRMLSSTSGGLLDDIGAANTAVEEGAAGQGPADGADSTGGSEGAGGGSAPSSGGTDNGGS